MLESSRIGLKVDVDTLRGTREGVPRLDGAVQKARRRRHFLFFGGSRPHGPRPAPHFPQRFCAKRSRAPRCSNTTVLKTLLYGVLLPGPDIGRNAGGVMRGVHDAGFEVGLHTYDHVRWQDYVAHATEAWTRIEFERGLAGL